MIISKGKIRLIRLRPEDIELVRQWRNSPEINRYMEYRGYITFEQQKEWYQSINNDTNLYFIIEHEYKKIGLINAKDINWEERSCESGVFYWDEEVYNTPVPIMVSMILSETFVEIFEMKVYARILKSNKRAIRYNGFMGFKLCDGQEDVENQLYYLNRENYLKKADKVRKAFYLLVERSPVIVLLEKRDYETGIGPHVEDFLERNTVSDMVEKEEGKLYVFREQFK
jgi:UDP-4-amino-4,6-dideoxy-N-acetyl-beta-L-altrosamine N-acetyltransferase